MGVDVREEPLSALSEHARISTAFDVDRVFDVGLSDGGLGGILLTERRLDSPFVKDYDAEAGEGPTRWAARFDLTNWGLLSAWIDGHRVGGAVIAFDTSGVHMLRGRRDLAVLWDIRVAPDRRRSGVGSALFLAVRRWASAKGCRRLEVETQNVNVPACRFYARHGCELAAIDRLAYPELPDEVELLWFQDLR